MVKALLLTCDICIFHLHATVFIFLLQNCFLDAITFTYRTKHPDCSGAWYGFGAHRINGSCSRCFVEWARERSSTSDSTTTSSTPFDTECAAASTTSRCEMSWHAVRVHTCQHLAVITVQVSIFTDAEREISGWRWRIWNYSVHWLIVCLIRSAKVSGKSAQVLEGQWVTSTSGASFFLMILIIIILLLFVCLRIYPIQQSMRY